jgi:N-acetylglucosaminyl-diphospho-decaprenol L-rhamnosyltransferase
VIHDGYLSSYRPNELPAARRTSFMCGAAPVFMPGAWSVLGGFRDDLFLYWEDAELSLRAQDAGLRMTVLGQNAPPVWHAVGGTSEGSGQSNAFYFYSARNRIMVMAERTSLLRALRPAASFQLIKFALRPLRNERSNPVQKSAQVIRGLLSGLRLSIQARLKGHAE